MIHLMTAIWLLVAGGVGIGTYLLSHEVGVLERQYAVLRRSIRLERETIHVLRAEWSHLNAPDRLENLRGERAALAPVATHQFARFEDLPRGDAFGFYRLDKYGDTMRTMPTPHRRPVMVERGDDGPARRHPAGEFE